MEALISIQRYEEHAPNEIRGTPSFQRLIFDGSFPEGIDGFDVVWDQSTHAATSPNTSLK